MHRLLAARPRRRRIAILSLAGLALLTATACATGARARTSPNALRLAEKDSRAYVERFYVKSQHMVPMRDGVRLHTTVYRPRDTKQDYPVILFRTPYSTRPYEAEEYPTRLGPDMRYAQEGFIFVYQDVRGKYMSEGEFDNMTPHLAEKTSPQDTDESSDTWDTVEWIVNNVPNNNGRVGQWGISYPGFYSAAGMIDHHPALVAVSPQAPIADWWYDDFHHHGAFFLPHTFNFIASFGKPRPEPTPDSAERFDHGTPDGYQFFKDLGPLSNANERYLHNEIEFWNLAIAHPNYDEFWQARNLLPHLKNVSPAVLTVGGWFDAEDLYGPLNIYRVVERENPKVDNRIVMGPWAHGGWHRGDGDHLGNVSFEHNNSEYFVSEIEFPFFMHHLKGAPAPGLAEATMFETGANQWREFDAWPPPTESRDLFFRENGSLTFEPPNSSGDVFDEFISDPNKPVPFTTDISIGMTRNYMTDDQRFAARRPDVLVYETDILEEDITLAGPILADLWVSTSGTASDWVVKVIDVFPPDAENHDFVREGQAMGNYHMMVRSEVIRGRFRNDPSRPEPFVPYEPARVRLPLQDVLHTFKKGHKIQVQVQCTWFPLVDLNPHNYVDNVYLDARPEDFIRATQRVHRSTNQPSRLRVGVLPQAKKAE